jgi:COP9 signalosome complex subunit 5|tara:strand:+ start:450 stop:1100 length:651 start_codon:yes stop_codon:yes gene_type:complete
MSGIDCSTQTLNQQYTEPFVAIVLDPVRTCIAEKVDIGAFRTYPHGYMPSDKQSKYQTIPLHKVEDFGAHANRYYSLGLSLFKSGLDAAFFDLLLGEYWISVLSRTSMQMNRAFLKGQIYDLAKKLETNASDTEVIERLRRSSSTSSPFPRKSPRVVSYAAYAMRDAAKVTMQNSKELASQLLKLSVFCNQPLLEKGTGYHRLSRLKDDSISFEVK